MNRNETDGVEMLLAAGLESQRALMGAAVAAQEQGARLALGVLGGSVGMLAGGAAANRALLEHYMAQQEALLSLAARPFGAEPRNGEEEELPIDDYDRLGAEELGRRLTGLCARDVEKLKVHERRTRNRPVMMERLDRSLV